MRPKRPELTQQLLHERLIYEPETGLFRWRVQRWRRRPGDPAGSAPNSRGHTQVSVCGWLFYTHQLAWLYVYGEWPPCAIDHINGVHSDNRISNLRLADNYVNAQNLHAAPKTNRNSGLLGVTRVKGSQKWQARITAEGKQHYLGVFETSEAAHQAYLVAKRALHRGCTI